jgi:ACS family hexuronate transporter-like MFS transporter
MQPPLSGKRQLIVLLALFAAWSIAYADRIVIGTAIIPIAKEFALNDGTKGYVLGAFYLTYALMQLGGGWLADRYGSRKVLVSCLLLWSIFTALTGAAWSLGSLIGFRLLFGLGEGSFSPANASAITETFAPIQRGRVQSLMCSTVYLGSAFGSVLVGWTIYRFGWRATFPLLGSFGLIAAVVLFFALMPRPRFAQNSVEAAPLSTWRDVLRSPLLWRVAMIWFGSCTLSIGLQSWMPSYLLRTHGIDILHIGMISAIPSLVGFFGTIAVGYIIDLAGSRHLKSLLASGALLSAFFLALMVTTASLPALIVYWTLCLLSFDMVYATVFSIPLKHFPAEIAGRTTGLINFGGQMAGAIAPVVMGHLIMGSHGSYVSAFYFLIGAGVIASAVAVGCNFVAPTQSMPVTTI